MTITYHCQACDSPVLVIDYWTRLSCGDDISNVIEIDPEYDW